MAFTQTLPDDILSVIADQVSSNLEDSGEVGEIPAGHPGEPIQPIPPPDAPSTNYTIAESFEIWIFARAFTKEYETGNRDLSTLVRRSGVWHHQLKVNESPAGFARSKPLGPAPESWSVREIFWSPLAKRIDDAIEWIDAHVPDEVEARLLNAPFQQTVAFWFVTKANSPNADEWNDRFLIVVSARHLRELKPGTVVNSSTFLKAMAGPKPFEGFNRKRKPARNPISDKESSK